MSLKQSYTATTLKISMLTYELKPHILTSTHI